MCRLDQRRLLVLRESNAGSAADEFDKVGTLCYLASYPRRRLAGVVDEQKRLIGRHQQRSAAPWGCGLKGCRNQLREACVAAQRSTELHVEAGGQSGCCDAVAGHGDQVRYIGRMGVRVHQPWDQSHATGIKDVFQWRTGRIWVIYTAYTAAGRDGDGAGGTKHQSIKDTDIGYGHRLSSAVLLVERPGSDVVSNGSIVVYDFSAANTTVELARQCRGDEVWKESNAVEKSKRHIEQWIFFGAFKLGVLD